MAKRGRKAQVRYWKSRNGYFTAVGGVQTRLGDGPDDAPNGPNYLAALRRWQEILAADGADTAGDENLVVTVLDRYGVHLKEQGRTGSLTLFARCLEEAIKDFGGKRVCELKPIHVQEWLNRMGQDRGRSRGNRLKKWGDTQKRMAVDKLTTALNWAVEMGMIARNPIKTKHLVDGLRKKGKGSRGKEHVLRAGEHKAMLAAAKPYFADLLAFLEATGCRPGEAYNVTAAHWNPADHTIVFPWDADPPAYVHKTARKTEKDRVIYVEPELVPLVQRRAAEHPAGPIFTNRDGKAWTNSSVHLMLKRIRRRLGLNGAVIPYSYRHTFATRWLLAGGSIKILADLLGNSVTIIERHYGHLEVDKAVMLRRLLETRATIRADEERAALGRPAEPGVGAATRREPARLGK